ncbi:MAG: hypothetical protein IH606_15065 [Burkholderiales bacterium]|nr:hypothetical protein [Burkholderiales bacterium]
MKTDLRCLIRAFLTATSVVGIVFLAGCGGSSSSSDTPAVTPAPSILISGVAATGAPITPAMNGVVTIQDSASPAHTASTPTDGNGNYSFTAAQLSGWTTPYLMEINYQVAGVEYNLHSAATASDLTSGSATINITPLTDLVIANLAGTIAANVFKNQATYANQLTSTALSAGAQALAAQIAPVLAAQGVSSSVDLFRQSFSADGTGLDAVLDALKVTQDPVTNTATITNRLDGSKITNDLTATNTTVLPTPTDTVPVTDLQAITAGFNNFSTLMAGAPAPTDPALLALFDETNFRLDGQSLAQFLQEVTTDPQILGGTLSFADISLSPVPDGVTVPAGATASYKVNFTVLLSGFLNSREEFIAYKNASGNWILMGNQRIAKVRMEVLETSGFTFNGTNNSTSVLCTGLYPQVSDEGGTSGVNFAVVTGPGLPAAGVLLFKTATGTNGNDFTIAAGAPDTYAGATTTAKTTDCGFTSLYPLADAAIAEIAASPMTYTVKLYQDGAGAPSFTNSTLLATYTSTLAAPPLTSTQLSSALFVTAGSATPSILSLATGSTAGTTTVSWTAPTAAGLFASSVHIFVSDQSGVNDSVSKDIPGTATSASLAVPQLANAANAGVTVNYMDNSFRTYWTTF